MHIKKLKVRPQKSTCTLQVTFPISPFTLLYLLPPPLRHLRAARPFIHSVLRCHRPACGALRPATRVDAWMLGSHERRQIDRSLSRACPSSLRMHAYGGAIAIFWFVSLQGTDIFDRVRQPMKRKQHRPSINYHLARLGKTLKD